MGWARAAWSTSSSRAIQMPSWNETIVRNVTVATSGNKRHHPVQVAEVLQGDPMFSNAMRLMTTPSALRSRILRVYAFLFAFNIGAWLLAIVASIEYPILLPTALLAY